MKAVACVVIVVMLSGCLGAAGLADRVAAMPDPPSVLASWQAALTGIEHRLALPEREFVCGGWGLWMVPLGEGRYLTGGGNLVRIRDGDADIREYQLPASARLPYTDRRNMPGSGVVRGDWFFVLSSPTRTSSGVRQSNQKVLETHHGTTPDRLEMPTWPTPQRGLPKST